MRFKFDPEYVSGAIVLGALIGVLAVAVYFVGGSEIRYWQHPYDDGWPSVHLRVLGAVFLSVVVGLLWLKRAFQKRKNRMRLPPMSRRMAAFVFGPIGAAPLGIYETVTKSWMTGFIYFAVAFAASGFVVATYIGPRYSDPDV